MKITCDLCDGTLQMNQGGQGATCTTCGLTYTMARLREKLTVKASVATVSPATSISNDIIYDVKDWQKADTNERTFDFVPVQFTMSVTKIGADHIAGQIQQGGIGLGDSVYINHDYEHPYTVRRLNDGSLPDAKAGMWVQLYLKECPKRILKKSNVLTGNRTPVANAYNYPGDVYEYFSHLLTGAFENYEIRRDMYQDDPYTPVTYLFYLNQKPILVLFLINSKDCAARTQVKRAARSCAQEGVACIHFYEDYRNDASYVINRVRDALG